MYKIIIDYFEQTDQNDVAHLLQPNQEIHKYGKLIVNCLDRAKDILNSMIEKKQIESSLLDHSTISDPPFFSESLNRFQQNETVLRILECSKSDVYIFFLNILLSMKQYELLLPMFESIPHSKLIENFESYILDSIDTSSDFLIKLYNFHVINSAQMRDIELERTPTEQNKQLFNIISKSSAKSFNLFLTALALTGRSNLLEQIQLMHSKTDTLTTLDDEETESFIGGRDKTKVETVIESQFVEVSTGIEHSNSPKIVSLPSDQNAGYKKVQPFGDENVAVMQPNPDTLRTENVYENRNVASEQAERKIEKELEAQSVEISMLNIDNGSPDISGIYSIPPEPEAEELLHFVKDEEKAEIGYTLENKKRFFLRLKRIQTFSNMTSDIIKNQASLPDDIQHQLFLKMKATRRGLSVEIQHLSRHLFSLLGFHSRNANCAYNQEVAFTYHMENFSLNIDPEDLKKMNERERKTESSLKLKVKLLYPDIITRIDPAGNVVETLVAKGILTSQQMTDIEAMLHPEHPTEELLSILFNTKHSQAFSILKEALKKDHSEVVEMIDGKELHPDDEHDAVSDNSEYEQLMTIFVSQFLFHL